MFLVQQNHVSENEKNEGRSSTSLFLSFTLDRFLLPLKYNLSFGQDGNGIQAC